MAIKLTEEQIGKLKLLNTRNVRGLYGKYPAILYISRTGRVALM